MSTLAIQDDYGGFDSRFLGITLRFWPKSWELFQQVNGPARLPEDVIEIGNSAFLRSPEEAFEVFSVGTVVLHELRHFHDFLLSPYGNYIFRKRMFAAMNGTAALQYFKEAKAAIPVPLIRWRTMSAEDKNACLEEWSRTYGFSRDRFAMEARGNFDVVMAATEQAYGRIKDMVSAPSYHASIEYQPYHIFEGSAINVQAGNVWSVFGEPHTQLFLDYLLNRPEARDYTLALRAIYSLSEKWGLPTSSTLVGAMLTWSMLGDYVSNGWNACPTVRLAQLSKLVDDEGPPPDDSNVLSLFAGWSERLGVPDVFETIRRTSNTNRNTLSQLEALPDETKAAHKDFIQLFRQFAAAQELMASAFSSDPYSYVRPDLYAENCAALVAAPIRIQFPYMPLGVPEEEAEKPFHVLSALKTDDGQLAVRSALLHGPSDGIPAIDAELAASVNDILTLVDFLFADFGRDDPDFDVVRQVVSRNGLLAMEIL